MRTTSGARQPFDRRYGVLLLPALFLVLFLILPLGFVKNSTRNSAGSSRTPYRLSKGCLAPEVVLTLPPP